MRAKGLLHLPARNGPARGTGLREGNTGGGTRWLTTSSPVITGEIIALELMIFDVGDYKVDSSALLDDFRWSPQPAGVITE